MRYSRSASLPYNATRRRVKSRRLWSLEVEGFVSPQGNRWARICQNESEGWCPISTHDQVRTAQQYLAQHQMYLSKHNVGGQLQDLIAGIIQFVPCDIIEGVGWTGKYFAFPDQTVIQPGSPNNVKVVFPSLPAKCVEHGTHDAWLKSVARPVMKNEVVMFFVQAALVPPVLSLAGITRSPAIELIGPPSCGKSLVLKLAASTAGSPGGNRHPAYSVSFKNLLLTLDQQIAAHGDLPVFVDEVDLVLAGETVAKRAACFKALAYTMQGGGEVAFDGIARGDHRFGLFSSSREPLHTMIDADPQVTDMINERVKTLRIGPDRPFGVFDAIPAGYGGAAEFADAVLAGAQANHGTAIQIFVRYLVQFHAEHPARLAMTIWVMKHVFRREAGVNLNDGAAVQTCDAFGIVAVAAFLAIRCGALPTDACWKSAALAAYRLHLASQPTPPSFIDQLRLIAAGQDVVAIEGSAYPGSEMADAANVFLKRTKRGAYLLVRDKFIEQTIPNWPTLRRNPAVIALLKKDKDRQTIKCKLAAGGVQETVFCFRLPA